MIIMVMEVIIGPLVGTYFHILIHVLILTQQTPYEHEKCSLI